MDLHRYIPALKGVVLAHSNIEFITQKGKILGDCPFATFEIAFDAIVWSPEVGMRLGSCTT
jgi:DNA-directed RNA polymerase I subunit RPA43